MPPYHDSTTPIAMSALVKFFEKGGDKIRMDLLRLRCYIAVANLIQRT